MNEKILKKLEMLIDKTLDATLADRGLKTSQKEALTVIETVTDTLKTLDKIKTARAAVNARGLKIMSENKGGIKIDQEN